MDIPIKPATEAYLRSQVALGRFGSIADAIDALVEGDKVMQADLGAADLLWAKPRIEQGLADFNAGRIAPAETVHDEMRRRFRIDK